MPPAGGGKVAAGGLFERLGLATKSAPAARGPPPPRRLAPASAAAGLAKDGDLMDMFDDSCVLLSFSLSLRD